MKTRAVLVRRNPYVGAVAVAGVAGFALTIVTALVSPDTAPDLVLAIVAFGWPVVIGLTGAWVGGWRAWRTEVALEIADRALRIDGATLRPPDTLTQGDATVLAADRVEVELRSARRPRVLLEVPTADAAREVLAALGLDRRAGTSKFHVRRLREYAGLLSMVGIVSLPLGLLFCILSPALGLPILALLVGGPLLGHVRARIEGERRFRCGSRVDLARAR